MGLQEANQLLAAISRAQTHFLDDDPPKQLFDDLLTDFLTISKSKFGFVGEIYEDATGAPYLKIRSITNIAWNDATQALYEASKRRAMEFRNLDTLFGEVIKTHEVLISNSPSDDKHAGGIPEGHPPLENFLGIPVLAGDVIVGMVGLANHEGGYEPGLVEFLQPLLEAYGRIISLMRANKRRNELEARLSAIVDSAADAILVIDDRGIIESCNHAAQKIFGREVNEMVGRNISILMPEPYSNQHDHYLQKYRDGAGKGVIGVNGREVLGLRANGDVFPMLLAVAEFWIGEERYFSGIVRDMSALNDAKLEQRRYKEILDQVQDCVFMFDADSLQFVYVNQGAIEQVGYSQPELLAMHPYDIKPAFSEDGFIELISPLKAGEQSSLTFTTQHQHKDDHLIPIEISLQYVEQEGDVGLFVAIVRDITDRIETETALRESDERLRHSQVFANIGTWDWNIKTGELFWSERIAPLFGYAEGQLETTYENFIGSVHPDDRQTVTDAVTACVEQGVEYNIEHRVVWPDGSVHWVLERGDVVRDLKGEPLRMLGVVQDISDRKQAELDLQAAKDEAERASQAKTEFLSSMSHELRTPLNAMMGFAQLFEYDSSVSDEHKKTAGEIYSAGKHLSTLIDEVLDLSKIEAGHLNISLVPVAVAELVEECRMLVEPMAEKRSIRVTFDPALQKHICVIADYTRLKQVFLNLLSNAVKYNHDKGEISFGCTALDDGYIRFTVSDTGMGIQDKDKAHVFTQFSRLHTDMLSIEGTGIGLTITKQFVDAMGGRIGFESEFGQGSSFWVELQVSTECPLACEIPEVHFMGSTQEDAEKVAHILLAEDNPTNQEVFRRQVEILGYGVDIANDGLEALDMFKRSSYDLVLTDVHMPHMDGYGLARAIREYECGSDDHVPIVAATANAMGGERERCLDAGMDDYLSKPIDLKALQASIEGLLHPQEGDLTQQTYIPVTRKRELAESEELVIDLSVLTRLVGDDIAAHTQIIDNFIAGVPRNILDIHSACNSKTASDLKFAAHRFKSGARAIGALSLADMCQMMEDAAQVEAWERIQVMEGEIDSLVQRTVLFLKNSKLEEQSPQAHESLTTGFERVLIVDDDPFALDLLEHVLNEVGIEGVNKALSGADALAQMDEQAAAVELVICDLNMPGMDGIEYLRHLGARNFQGSVVLLSGEDSRVLSSALELARTHTFKAVAALEKPVQRDELVRLLNGLQPRKQPFARPAQPTVELADLKRAIVDDEFVLNFQPKVDVCNKALVGSEALVRWQLPGGGVVMPDLFIPLAEKEGLIDDLTDLVMDKAVRQVRDWRDQDLDLKVAINLDVGTIGRRLEFPEQVVSCLEKYQLLAQDIVLEITESGVMNDIATSLDTLVRLRLKGLTLSIDDFGTGYSTFKQLQGIPFTELKVDRSFVAGADADPASRAILESSVMLGQKLGMGIVAEGVETREDWNLIASMGCHTIQGYFVSRPMPGAEMIPWLDEWRQRAEAEL